MICGKKSVRIIVDYVVATAFKIKDTQHLLEDELSKLTEIKISSINKAITLFRKVKYISLRKIYTAISLELLVRKHNYSFRVSIKKRLLMNTLQEMLKLKLYMIRDGIIVQH